MFQYFRKAVSGVQVRDNSRDNLVRDEYQKKKIKEYLASVIKQLQKTYVSSSSEYIIERNDECAQNLCIGLEAVFLHGLTDHGNSLQTGATLRSMFFEGITSSEDDYDQEIATKAFWEIVKEVTHSDVITQLKHLVVTTDVGLSRAWIRLALNDGLIISYLDAILADSPHLRKYYGQNAFLMDRELPGILKELLQGLGDFQFRLNYNSSKLNSWDVLPLQLSGHIQHTETSKSSDSTDGKFFTGNTTERLKDIETKNDMDGVPQSPVAIKVSEEIKAEITGQGMSSVNPLSSTPAQPSEVQESQHGSSATSLSLSESLEATSPPHENANTHNIPSLSNSFSNYSPATQQRMAGNRLGGQGWEGWSSSFENDPAENFTRKSSAEDEKLKSFGSLLQKYGHNGVVENGEFLFDESNNQPALSTIIPQSGSDGKNEKMVGVHSPAANDPNLVRMNFEVVPSSTSTQGQFLDQRARLSVEQLTSIGCEQGLDKQNFRCKGCAKPIGLIYGPYRVCHLDGGYYCSDCHDEEEHLIPARVIQNWDFKRYKVSKDSKIFLMKIEEEPLFHVDEINPFLYEVIMDLREVKVLRIQLQHIKGYIHTCRQEIIEDFRRRLWPREYLAEDVHQYSLLDLVQIQNGQLAHHLRKVIQQFTKHIFKCNLCCQKGFICEYCNDKTIIYPFQVNIAVQCPGCLSVFHKKCRQDKRCPKCVRIHLRHQNRDMDLKVSVTQKEQYIGRDIL